MNQQEKEKPTETAQNEQAPQDENPLSSPEPSTKKNTTKTLNDPLERKRDEEEDRKKKHND